MREEYKVFDKGFNKVLDLVESYNSSFYNKYKSVIDTVDDIVLDAVVDCEDFATGNAKYDVDFMRLPNAVSLDYTRKKKFLRSEIYVHRIFEEDLFKMGVELKLFSIDIRNCEKKPKNLEFYYEVKNNKLNFVGTNDTKDKIDIDIHYQIDLVSENDEFYLVCTKELRGVPIYSKEIPISFDELYQYVETEEEYEEDMEVEFDADFDL